MGTKEEWEEIEKTYKERQAKIEKEYGIDITKLEKKTKKSRKKIDKINKILEKLLKIFLIMIIIILIIDILYVVLLYKNLYKMYNVDVQEAFEERYNMKAKILETKGLDERKNGIYIMQTEKNEQIRFVAYRQGRTFECDYASRNLKYFYEKWENEDKNKFKINESINEKGLLNYELTMEIENLETIDTAIELCVDLSETAGESRLEDWNIFVVKQNFKYPAISTEEDKELNKNNVKRQYAIWIVQNNINREDINITEEVVEKYAKPFIVPLNLNGEDIKMTNAIIYDYKQDQYCVPIQVLKYIENAIIEEDETGKAQKLIYKGETYTVTNKQNLDNNEIEQNYTIEDFNKVFGTSLYYDYRAMRVISTK